MGSKKRSERRDQLRGLSGSHGQVCVICCAEILPFLGELRDKYSLLGIVNR